jgi:hypothetical protein
MKYTYEESARWHLKERRGLSDNQIDTVMKCIWSDMGEGWKEENTDFFKWELIRMSLSEEMVNLYLGGLRKDKLEEYGLGTIH